MSQTDIYLASTKMNLGAKEVNGESVVFENENYYKISNYDGMRTFFMSIVSHSDHWMFISSNGGLTAGRKNAENALFPYYTDDKIMESAHNTGSKTIIHVHHGSKTHLWEPFMEHCSGLYDIQRNLYKNTHGNKIVFEETNHNLRLTFRYHWNFSEAYGFVKKSQITNHGDNEVECTLLDGIQNIMPFGVPSATQNNTSNLVDAYKRNQLEADTGLGIFALSSIIVDKAEPSEALKATTVWSLGLENPKYLLSNLQLDTFRRGLPIEQELDVKAEKGAYFVNAGFHLEPHQEKEWILIAEVNQSSVDVGRIKAEIKDRKGLSQAIETDIETGTKELIALVGAADGLQCTADGLNDARHYSNTLFNIMRGGIFDDGYLLYKWDFTAYIEKASKKVFQSKKQALEQMPEHFTLDFLKQMVDKEDDPDLKRLSLEYLPLKFSRRHGDPSRPWNRFSINTKADDGSKLLDYEGNWRDIFQNWEALALSYPAFLESMICKFLNASTFDGYNPYRVTKDGFDWEVIEPDDPWSYIGYWGDHQIIYLLKLLELLENHYPGSLKKSFNERIFVYANVPYKIKGYHEIVKNPKDTIVFDTALDVEINKNRERIGADAALLTTQEGSIYHVTLMEKILATVLCKISNFIPEGGIWMNTQRPEWNDANNALVGNGVSMVTLCYLRRFLAFFETVLKGSDTQAYPISKELVIFFKTSLHALLQHKTSLTGKISDTQRKTLMDALGMAGGQYRDIIYAKGFEDRSGELHKTDILQFIETAKAHLEHSIEANKRMDQLYHAYNLITIESDKAVSISHLPEMLEGQVAVLSSEYLTGAQSLEVLNALKQSALFKDDQYSYLLYPNRELPRFCEKNIIPDHRVDQSELFQKLLKEGDISIIEKSRDGTYHFNGSFNNAESLKMALFKLTNEDHVKLVEKEYDLILGIFEEVFNHKAFTGRSGTFYGYEGLGSIYWHMVSKLLLSVQETCARALENHESEEVIGGLLEHFYEINAGIGVHKSPTLYGAIPTDPYSHTPAGKGAQQPGMTGQVKEDILTRFGELGVLISDGTISFEPTILRKDEFLQEQAEYSFINLQGKQQHISLSKNSLGFTYCQVPVVYHLSKDKTYIKVQLHSGDDIEFKGLKLDRETSQMIFGRTDGIKTIQVYVNEKQLK